MDAKDLLDIEEIKQVKARYFRYLDRKQWEAWGELFTRNAVVRPLYSWDPEFAFHGRDTIVKEVSTMLTGITTVHHGHMPEIELTSETTAAGIWAMYDFVDRPGNVQRRYGHYKEEYVKEDGKWKINNLRLTRLRVDVNNVRQHFDSAEYIRKVIKGSDSG